MLSYKKLILAILSLVLVISAFFVYVFVWLQNRPVTLEFGVFSGSNWDMPNLQSYKIFDDAIARFEKENPKVKVKYRYGTLKSDYSEWLSQKIIKGNEPDVFCVLSEDFNTLSAIGILKNLDELMKKDKRFDINKIYMNAIISGQFQNSQYALPSEASPILMFLNKTLLKQEGIPMPNNNWTWDDFYKICKKVTRDTNNDGVIDQFGVAGYTWQNAVYTNGQQLFDTNGERAFFDSPGVLEAVKFSLGINKLDSNLNTPDFDGGRVAFRPFPFNMYKVYRVYPYRVKMFADFDWGCVKLPRGPKGKNSSELYSFLIGISSRTKYTNEAWDFLKFLTYNEDTQMNVIKYSQGVPVLKSIVESNVFDEELSRNNPDRENFIDKRVLSEIIEDSIVVPRFQKYESAMNLADKEIFQLNKGDKDIENTLVRLNREIDALLKQ